MEINECSKYIHVFYHKYITTQLKTNNNLYYPVNFILYLKFHNKGETVFPYFYHQQQKDILFLILYAIFGICTMYILKIAALLFKNIKPFSSNNFHHRSSYKQRGTFHYIVLFNQNVLQFAPIPSSRVPSPSHTLLLEQVLLLRPSLHAIMKIFYVVST